MIDALKIIVARSPQAASQAMQCISAIKAKSLVVQQRYNHTVNSAFSDPNAEFSPDERDLIASYIAGEGEEEARTLDVRVRVNDEEKQRIQRMAKDANQTVSDFVRSSVGL